MRQMRKSWVRVTVALAAVAFCAATGAAVLAGSVRNVTMQKPLRTDYGAGAFDDAGTVLYIASTENLQGGDPLPFAQVIRFDVGTSASEQVTDLSRGVEGAPAVSDDGQYIVFLSTSDPLGLNGDHSVELFTGRTDGTGLAQLTDHPASETGTIQEVAFAGSGTRSAFIGTTDPFGTNPNHVPQVFVVNRDGTGFAQITNHTSFDTTLGLTISDDGQRIAYAYSGDPFGTNTDHGLEIFVILADGTGRRQLTSGFDGDSTMPSLSGNGARVAFASNASLVTPNPLRVYRILVVDWDGGNLHQLTSEGGEYPGYPAIVDDGTLVVYHSNEESPQNLDLSDEIWRIDSAGTNKQEITSTVDGNRIPVVAGAGGRVAFLTLGPYPGGLNDDGGVAVITTDADGNDARLVAERDEHRYSGPDVTGGGTRITFLSNQHDPVTNPASLWQVWKMEFDGSGLGQVTTFDDGEPFELGGITDDGGTIVFSAGADPVGQNPSHSLQIFAVNADGTNLRQLTPSANEFSRYPDVADDGSWVVFQSSANFVGGNPDLSGELFRVRLDGTALDQLTDDGDNVYKAPRLDGTGTWVVFQSAGDPLGTNPDRGVEVFRIRTDGTGLEQITADPAESSEFPDIDATGEKIVYDSKANPLGTNPDYNYEIFLYDVASTTTTQLTETEGGRSWHPRLSRDGAYVYFKSTAPLFGEETKPEPYRQHLTTGVTERVGGLPDGDLGIGSSSSDETVVPDGDGQRAVFVTSGDRDGSNPDHSSDIFGVDFSAPASIFVGKETPTVVSWTAEPRYALYDVIRGDVANLQIVGETVDLGPVVCLEDDSHDNSTFGNADPEQPAPGQVFFFVYRGSQGPADAPGSWGQGTEGRERIPGSGSCLP